MANWDDGYITDVPYTAEFHYESSPVWIATAAALLNTTAPDLSRPFCYADLGCGYGVTALVTAATMPHAEIWAFDFNPAHVASGRDIAHRAGLTNIHFEEASFEQLANRPSEALPMFDYIVAHGVFSWISLENRRHLFKVFGQRLAPGGIAYISYLVSTGWSGMQPVHTLMRLLAEESPERSDVAAAGVLDLLGKMKIAGAATFRLHPELDDQLAKFRQHDQRYIAHELLNRDWHPVMFPDVASDMAGIKCDYLGSATMHENFLNLTVPAAMRDMVGEVRDVVLRETLRDIASASPFRRDLYQRGPRRMSAGGLRTKTNAIALTRTFTPVPEPIVLPVAIGTFTADQEHFHALLEACSNGPRTIGALRDHAALADWPDPSLLDAATILMALGYLRPVLNETPSTAAVAATAQLNAVHAALFEEGDGRPFLAYPTLGAAWHTDEIEILALDELRTGRAAAEEPLAAAVLERVMRGGYRLNRHGQLVNDPDAMREIVSERVRDMLEHRLPAMRRMGALPVIEAKHVPVE